MKKQGSASNQEEAFEIIELATQDIEVLARAFDVIQKVCEECEGLKPELEDSTELTLH